MKKIKNYILPLSLLILFGLISCTDTFELHQKYIKDGETVYATRVDSLTALSGNDRLKIAGYLTKGFAVNEITVLWNRGENSQSFPYTKSDKDIDTLGLIISDLEEGTHEFKVFTKDVDGNESIKISLFGTVYGEAYRSNLEPRTINYFNYNSDGSATINLRPSDDFTRSTEIKYTKIGGEEAVVKVLKGESDGMLTEVDLSKPIMYRTFYVPTLADENGVETSIDEFGSDWATYTVPVELQVISDSFTLEPVPGGVTANWENASNLQLDFSFKYTVAGELVEKNTTSSESTGTYTVSGMEAGEQNIEITVTDAYGNSWPKTYTVTPLSATGKGSWSIVDFSTQEAGGEGPVNGYATAAIDGDLETFWHSNWSTTGSSYPHHLTIDMGAEKVIAGFQVFTRNGDGRGATAHEFWVSSDNVNFTKVATLNAAIDVNNGTLVNVDVIMTGRYVKYVATAGPESFTFLGEINVIERLDNSDWSVVDFSTQEDGGEGPVNGYATAAIDGDLATFWHSNWSSTGSSYPHHLTIDLGAEKTIATFEVFTRNGDSRGATAHEFWVSSDNVNFTKVATLNAAIDVNNGALVNADVITTGRYVKYVATAGPESFTFLGELRVFGVIN